MSARGGWAWPLVPLYRLGLALAERFRGKPKVLGWPVVSVGSLSAGGAGKTPVVIALAGLVRDAGWGVDVLSRGYGRGGGGVERVAGSGEQQVPFGNDNQKSNSNDNKGDNSKGDLNLAARFGDEPVLIAERAEIPVFVGASRFAAGMLAEAAMDGRSLHLLDDGFQHRQLARAVDVVLVTADDLEDVLIPAGNLREPLAALGRADVVIVREDEVECVAKRIWPLMREGAQMWVVRRRLRFPAPLFVFGAGLKPIAFCGLARPEGFAAMLIEAGCGIVETVGFWGHYR